MATVGQENSRSSTKLEHYRENDAVLCNDDNIMDDPAPNLLLQIRKSVDGEKKSGVDNPNNFDFADGTMVNYSQEYEKKKGKVNQQGMSLLMKKIHWE